MTRDDVVKLIDEWQRALENRDPVAFTALYAEHAMLESPLGGSLNGREAVRKAFDAFFKAFPDATFLHERPCIDGNEVVVVCSIAGTHSGGFGGLPASGNPFRFQLVFLLLVGDDGLIVRDRRIYDFTGLMVQIGMIKAKPRDR